MSMYGKLLSSLGWYPYLLLGIARQGTKTNMQDFGPSLSPSLQSLADCENGARLSFFYRYYFGRCPSELANWFHSLSLKGGLQVILIDCMTFLSPFLDVTRMPMTTVSFLAQLHSGILCL